MVIVSIGILVLSYIIGSIPFGLIIVKLSTGKDIRSVESGRTGGTNAMRAAGVWAGVLTAIFDVFKGISTVYLGHVLVPGNHIWLDILAPLCAIIGHNYSVFLIEHTENGWLRFRGGAGGATCLGGSIGLWPSSVLIILPLSGLIYYFGGYASMATLSVALLSTLVFGYRALVGLGPWQYSLYGLLSFIALAWALRPNIKRLQDGTERVVGLRAKKQKAAH